MAFPVFLAHVAAPSAVPGWAQWIMGALLWGGMLGALVIRDRRRRVLLIAAAVVGAGLTVTDWTLGPLLARPPDVLLRLASPLNGSHQNAVVNAVICGRTASGTAVSLPGPGRVLSITIDGHQVVETSKGSLTIEVTLGHHVITAELLNASHQEFRPAVRVQGSFDAGQYGAPAAPAPRC